MAADWLTKGVARDAGRCGVSTCGGQEVWVVMARSVRHVVEETWVAHAR